MIYKIVNIRLLKIILYYLSDVNKKSPNVGFIVVGSLTVSSGENPEVSRG